MNGIVFASAPPWWMTAAILIAAVAALLFAYRRPVAPLPPPKRAALVVLRALALAALLAILMRPVARLPLASATQTVVPILIDASGSMRVPDADGLTRIARARAIAQFDLAPALAGKYAAPLIDIGSANRSDLAASLSQARERFRGQRIAGIVLISDGGDTGAAAHAPQPSPVFAIGVGATSGGRDREIGSIAAGEQHLADASVDLDVSAASTGFGRAPYEIRLLANGTAVETRRVTPLADASPDRVRFTVFPDPSKDNVYTAEIPPAAGETVSENNRRTVLVGAAGRKRRVLVIAGAPGFEPSFMMRAWALDAGLEVDAVVRKGKNADAHDTYVIQAAADRTQALSSGFPQRREDLDAYDAVVLSDVEGGFFTRAQMGMLADFVAVRGGGLLVAGSRSLAPGGLIGTPLEAVLPVELDDRRSGVVRASFTPGARSGPNQLVVTTEGETHPVMRLGASGNETRARWAALPALAASAPLGPPRPGASVLAVVSAPDGGVFPVVAVQRYGQGRSMIFGGEASWRWRMLAPSTDRSHELFWRQTARWLAASSPDPVSIGADGSLEPGDSASADIAVRDAAFNAVSDAQVLVTVSRDGGSPAPLPARRTDVAGHFAATLSPDEPGLYRIHAEAARGATSLGAADRVVYVGAGGREFADPRLDEGLLRRLARDSGGEYVRASNASRVFSLLDDSAKQQADPEVRDLWNRPWMIVIVIVLLCAEWALRRRWGWR